MDKTLCLRCSGNVSSIADKKFQLGQTGFFSGSWSNLLHGSREMEVYVCSTCSKVEFYANMSDVFDGVPKKTCPTCAKTHDFDYPKCPFCKHQY